MVSIIQQVSRGPSGRRSLTDLHHADCPPHVQVPFQLPAPPESVRLRLWEGVFYTQELMAISI
jgi:hypothetical protein